MLNFVYLVSVCTLAAVALMATLGCAVAAARGEHMPEELALLGTAAASALAGMAAEAARRKWGNHTNGK